MNGKLCLVTGATSGIGRESARALAAAGARVLVHGRERERAQALARELAAATGNTQVAAVAGDFARLDDVRRLAAEVSSHGAALDVLLNNAGLMSAQRALSAEGYELTFAVNHLAPFLLTRLLMPRLAAAPAARIVVVSSEAHRGARLDFDDLMSTQVAGLLAAYGRSKLANLLFTRALAARLAGGTVTANALHPGVVRTHLFHRSPWLQRLMDTLGRPFLLSPEQGAATSVYLASSPEVAGRSGGYYARCRPLEPAAAALNDVDAERLWQASERLTGLPG